MPRRGADLFTEVVQRDLAGPGPHSAERQRVLAIVIRRYRRDDLFPGVGLFVRPRLLGIDCLLASDFREGETLLFPSSMLERSSRQLSDRDALIGHRDHQRVYQIVREPFALFVASRTFCTVVGSSKKPRRIELEFGE